jgi:ABC-type phosphate transport system substrate-binding protein
MKYAVATWHPEAARDASKNVRIWGQLGLTGKWKDAPIHVYGPNLEYSMARDFQQMVFQGGDKWTEPPAEYANCAGPDGTLKIAAEQLMIDLAKDPYGIGYIQRRDVPESADQNAVGSREGRRSLRFGDHRDGAEPHLPHAA